MSSTVANINIVPRYLSQQELFSILVILEFACYLILVFWAAILAYICYTVKVFHQHLNSLIFTLFFNFYLIAISRTIFIIITNFDQEYAYPPDTFDRTSYLFYLNEFKFLICHVFTLTIPTMVTERAYATIKLVTYEFTVIPFSFSLALLIVWIFGGTLAIVSETSEKALVVVMMIEVALNLAALIGFFILDYKNKQIYHSSNDSNPKYSLSARFQLAENIRYLQLIKRCAVFLTVVVLVVIVTLMVTVNVDKNFIRRCLSIAVHYTVILGAGSFSAIGLFSIEHYKKRFIRMFFYRKRIRSHEGTYAVELRDLEGKRMSFPIKQEADLYFSQLKKEWE